MWYPSILNDAILSWRLTQLNVLLVSSEGENNSTHPFLKQGKTKKKIQLALWKGESSSQKAMNVCECRPHWDHLPPKECGRPKKEEVLANGTLSSQSSQITATFLLASTQQHINLPSEFQPVLVILSTSVWKQWVNNQ